MPYAPLDDRFDQHPKYEQLELEHYGLMACAIAYCNRNLTDGQLSFKAVRGFGKSGKGPRLAKTLTDLGIWKDIRTGWEIVGFLDHNLSRAEVMEKRAAARARKDAYRKGQSSSGPPPRPPPSVPPSVPAGHAQGQDAGRDEGQPTGQDAGQNEVSLARARAAAGALHSTPLHSRGDPETPVGDAPHIGRGEEAYWLASYAEVVTDVIGQPWAFPKKELSSLRETVKVHCTRLSDIDGWLRDAVRGFVLQTRGRSKFWGHYGPDGLLKWLNTPPDERHAESGTVLTGGASARARRML